MPDTYTSQFSGEEIDAALRAAQIISGADTPAELRKKLEIRGDTIPVSATDPTPVSEALTASGGGVNPNLLDNWFFGRPVNQRGKTSYTAAGYTIDRWFLEHPYNLKIDATGLHFTPSSSDSFTNLIQKIPVEQWAILNGKTITVSAFTSDGKLLYESGTWTPESGPVVRFDNFEFSSAAFVNAQSYQLGRLYVYAGKSADVLAVKVELGSTQTLAHKENGVWVLNEIPDFGEQLRRCQRYFVRLTNTYGYGWTYNSSIANFFVSLPTTMRANPVIKLTTNGEIQTINGAKSVTGFEAKGIHPNGFAIDLHNSANALITGTPVTWHSSSMDISADL